jgi:glycosyltransferase involved in cell wall biosynthesis
MRLLILLGGQVFSGAEITTLRFAAALPQDWQVEVAVHPASMERAATFGFHTHRWEHESAPGDTLLRASHFIEEPNPDAAPGRTSLSQIVETFQPEAVLACMFPVAMLALPVLQQRGIRLFVHHQLMYKDMPNHPVTGPVRRVADYASCIIAASEAVEKPLRRSGINNVEVLPAGLPTDYGKRPTHSKPQKTRILAIGTWGPQKGIETLLEADQLLRPDNLDYDLIVAGPLDAYGTDYAEAVRSMAHADVKFIGNQPNPEPCYRDADILIIPSSEPDPYPTVTLEGMAHGLAIIATDCGGLSEQVVHNETGLLVPPTQPQAMADAMRKLITDSAQIRKLGAAGLAWIEQTGRMEHRQTDLANLLQAAGNL